MDGLRIGEDQVQDHIIENHYYPDDHSGMKNLFEDIREPDSDRQDSDSDRFGFR